jgi:uncharacterized SAM-binding protein YcdF (DUF218 family)
MQLRIPGLSFINVIIALLLAYFLGLVLFAHDAMGFPDGKSLTDVKADGIVVLTGGAERMEAGLDLLAHNAAPKLLISGVDPRADPKKLVPPKHAARKKINCCITFGIIAADTYGNAREAAAWAEHSKMKSLVVVTSNYHMRRSLYEFHLAMPGIVLAPYALVPGKVRLAEWWDYPGTASLMMSEYNKLLLAYARAPLHKLFGDTEPVGDTES